MKIDNISFTSAVHVKMPAEKIRGICPNDYNYYAMNYAIKKVKAISREGTGYINWPPNTYDYLIVNGEERAHLDYLKEKCDLAESNLFSAPNGAAVAFVRESLPKVPKSLPLPERIKATAKHIRALFELKKIERTPNNKWKHLKETPLKKLVKEKIEAINMENSRLSEDVLNEYHNGLNSVMDSDSTKKLVFNK